MPHRHTLLRRVVGGFTAALLATSGLFMASAVQTAPAAAAYPESVNPFSLAGGFTVYAREDLTLGNDETEGSLAAGGTTTLTQPTYSIIHVEAGTGDYSLPTVDGDPTRLLTGVYDPSSDGLMQITSRGTSDPALQGDLKMVDRDGPWQAFQRSDWLRLNLNPADVDQLPLIDATHQDYPADAEFPAGPSGNGSIYTVDTSDTAVADYVESNADTSWEQAQTCLGDIADPIGGTGYPVDVAEDAGDRVVLKPLSPDQPNVVDYAKISGASLIQFSPGPTPGVENPLVIRVAPGTTEVIGARADPQGAHSPYMLWDLSQLTGDVTVRAAQARIDGSIYAPNASVTVNAAPLDGQVVGMDVTLQGGEAHSFLFSGEIPCVADSGTFAIRKQLSGIAVDDLPPGTTFTVNYTAHDEDDAVISTGTLEVPADGTLVQAAEQFPLGTKIEFQEVTPETIPGWEWGEPSISPDPLTIGAGVAEVVVTNTATEQVGGFSLVKTIEDVTGGDAALPTAPVVPVDWTAWYGGEVIGTGTVELPFDGTVVVVDQQFPLGTRIVLAEDLTGIDPPDGYEWEGAHWAPGRTFVIDETGTVAVELTNAVAPVDDGRTVTIVKSATGEAADPLFEYAVSYNTNPAPDRTVRDLPVGDPELLDDIETGATYLELAELLPTHDGVPVDPDDWAVPIIRVTADDGSVSEHRPLNFEGAGLPLETAIVEIPLPETEDLAIEVVNALKEGTFTVSKEFSGILDGTPIVENLEFTVGWVATLPAGDVQRGTLRVSGDGTPVGPLNDEATPLTFPYGTVITLTELPAPSVKGVAWKSATFDPSQLIIGEDGQATVHSTLTNDALQLTGTFLVSKSLVGIDSADLLADSFTVEYEAHIPGGGSETGSFSLPADGTPAGPRDESGDPLEFPLGTVVDLAETVPDVPVLPPGYEWAETIWSPSSSVVIGLGATPVLEVTNTAVELTRWALVKTVSGDGASALPAGTTFPVDWWWDGAPQVRVELVPNVAVVSPYFPVGSIIEVREGELPSVPAVEWGTPVWTANGEVLTADEEGKVILPAAVTGENDPAELTLNNVASGRPLPATGGGGPSPLVPLAALAFILVGVALVASRHRSV